MTFDQSIVAIWTRRPLGLRLALLAIAIQSPFTRFNRERSE